MLALASDAIVVLTLRGTEQGRQSVLEFMARRTYGVDLHVEHPCLYANGGTVVLAARVELRFVDTGALAEASEMAAAFRVPNARTVRVGDPSRPAIGAPGWRTDRVGQGGR